MMLLFAEPRRSYLARREVIDAAIARVLDSGWYIQGGEVSAFEAEFAAYCGVPHALGVGTGTDALALALRAMGIGAGDEVIAPSHTAVATVAAIEMAGASPVLVDIDPACFALDPQAVEAAIGPRTRAVIAVHLYGQAADLDALTALADRHALRLIEDCAQATGAVHRGRRLGSCGDVGCFSFYPTKNLGAFGDGGMVVCRDPAIASAIRQLREYGWDSQRQSQTAGVNSRLDEMQAAILRAKLPLLDGDNARRRRIASLYGAGLAGLPLELPSEVEAGGHVYHLYVLRTRRRDALRAHLAERGIVAAIHYPVPIHLQPAYRGRCGGRCMVETERAAGEILTLPLFPELTDDEVRGVVAAVQAFFAESPR